MKKGSDMQTIELIEQFVKTYDNSDTSKYYEWLLFEVAKHEEDKMIHEMSINEIKEILVSFNCSPKAADSYGRILTAYFDYCVKIGLIHINKLNFVESNQFKELGKKNKDMYFNISEIRQLQYILDNPMDVAIIQLLFMGIKGKGMKEITHLKHTDVDYTNYTINLYGRGIKHFNKEDEEVKMLFKYLKKASNQTKIYVKTKSQEVGTTRPLCDSEYIIRVSNIKSNTQEEPVHMQILSRKFRIMKDEVSSDLKNKLVAANIYTSGMIYRLKEMIETQGSYRVDNDMIESIKKEFNDPKSAWTIKQIVNAETVKELYGDII